MDENQYPNWFMTDGMANFINHLIKEFSDKPVRFLQIGAYTGDASIWLAQYVLTHPDSILIDVDTWEGSDEAAHHQMDWSVVEKLYDAKTKIYRDNRKIIKYKGTSDSFFRNNREMYDFIYVDGDHTSYSVIKDAVHSYDCLKVNGIIAFDDYEWTSVDTERHEEPRLAIDSFWAIYHDRVRLIIQEYQAWFRKVS